MRPSPLPHRLRRANALLLAVIGMVLVPGTEARATDIVIDFESYTTGAKSSDFLSSDGISSITLVRDGSVVETVTVNPETSETNGNGSNPGGGNYLASAGNNIQGERVLTLVFSVEVRRFSFTRIDVDGQVSIPSTWEARAFDAAGSDLGISAGETSVPRFPASPASFSLLAPAGSTIHRVEFTIPPNLSTFAVAPLDDLILSPVPEPRTVGMLGLGLVGVGLRRRWGGRRDTSASSA